MKVSEKIYEKITHLSALFSIRTFRGTSIMPGRIDLAVMRQSVGTTENIYKRGNVNFFIWVARYCCDIAVGQKVYNNPVSGQNYTYATYTEN